MRTALCQREAERALRGVILAQNSAQPGRPAAAERHCVRETTLPRNDVIRAHGARLQKAAPVTNPEHGLIQGRRAGVGSRPGSRSLSHLIGWQP